MQKLNTTCSSTHGSGDGGDDGDSDGGDGGISDGTTGIAKTAQQRRSGGSESMSKSMMMTSPRMLQH